MLPLGAVVAVVAVVTVVGLVVVVVGVVGSLVAMGAPNTIYPMEEFCTKTSAGYGCAYYLLQYKNMKYLK